MSVPMTVGLTLISSLSVTVILPTSAALIRYKFMTITEVQSDYAAAVNLVYPIHIGGYSALTDIYDASLPSSLHLLPSQTTQWALCATTQALDIAVNILGIRRKGSVGALG
jgi:hypothetical protein